MTNLANIFGGDPITAKVGETEYTLKYDYNALAYLEREYGSIDTVLKKLFGQIPVVTVDGETVDPATVQIDGQPIVSVVDGNVTPLRGRLNRTDELNILYAGILPSVTIFTAHGDISGYTLGKSKLASMLVASQATENIAAAYQALMRDIFPVQIKADEAGDNPKNAPSVLASSELSKQ